MIELNRLYLAEDAFWREEYSDGQFEWLDCHEKEKGKVLSLMLHSDWETYGGTTKKEGRGAGKRVRAKERLCGPERKLSIPAYSGIL
ncbi:MAG: hypothetical protein J6B85_01935 [Lachnospiraceae bacterium]|nr:hypothetical protein [Lachnospiraceae bacterium]